MRRRIVQLIFTPPGGDWGEQLMALASDGTLWKLYPQSKDALQTPGCKPEFVEHEARWEKVSDREFPPLPTW